MPCVVAELINRAHTKPPLLRLELISGDLSRFGVDPSLMTSVPILILQSIDGLRPAGLLTRSIGLLLIGLRDQVARPSPSPTPGNCIHVSNRLGVAGVLQSSFCPQATAVGAAVAASATVAAGAQQGQPAQASAAAQEGL